MFYGNADLDGSERSEWKLVWIWLVASIDAWFVDVIGGGLSYVLGVSSHRMFE
jgi:hypothetical protein